MAKLSGIPNSAQISSVTTPAIDSGMSVSSMSETRPSTSQSRTRDRQQRPDARLDEGAEHGGAGFENVIGPSVASGSTASTALANLRIASLSFGSALGAIETRARPSGVIQSPTRSVGRFSRVTFVARQRSLQRARSRLSGATNTSSAVWRNFGSALARSVKRGGERFCRLGAGAGIVLGGVLEPRGGLVERFDVVLVGRRRQAHWRDRRRRRAPWRSRRSPAAARPDPTGMKNDSVVARETSGSLETLAAIASAASRSGASTSMRVEIGGGVAV